MKTSLSSVSIVVLCGVGITCGWLVLNESKHADQAAVSSVAEAETKQHPTSPEQVPEVAAKHSSMSLTRNLYVSDRMGQHLEPTSLFWSNVAQNKTFDLSHMLSAGGPDSSSSTTKHQEMVRFGDAASTQITPMLPVPQSRMIFSMPINDSDFGLY